MDIEAIKKINVLTEGVDAKKYFTENGLDYVDAVKIRKTLINEVKSDKLGINQLEYQIQLMINSLCYQKNIKDIDEKIHKNYDEKLLTFKYNQDYNLVKCTNCENMILSSFKYCPICGNEYKPVSLKIITCVNIDFTKGYVTPQELQYMKLVTEEEAKLFTENKVKYTDIGIQIDETNCPLEIRNELISQNKFLRDNLDARKELFNKNMQIQVPRFKNMLLSYLNNEELGKEKIFPIIKIKDLSINEDNKKPSRHILNDEESVTEENTENERKIVLMDDLPLNVRYAGVLYLLDTIENPKNPEIPDSILHKLGISSTRKFTPHLKNNNYVKQAEGIDLIKIKLSDLNVNNLKKILSDNDLKVSGRKSELIERICENVNADKLNKYSRGKRLIVTPEGMNYLNKYPHVSIYVKYLHHFDINEYEYYFRENQNHKVSDIIFGYLEHMRKIYTDKMKWHLFSLTYKTEYSIYRKIKNYHKAIESYINYFICKINPLMDNAIDTNYSNPIGLNDKKDIINAIDSSQILEVKIHQIFITESATIDLPYIFLTAEEMYNYFMRLYNDENLDIINRELSQIYSLDTVEEMKFYTKEEQEEKILIAKEYFN